MKKKEISAGKLLPDNVPAIIETEAENDRVLEIFNRLISRGENKLSPEESALFALLANLLIDYEKRILPPLENPKPFEILRFLMESNGLKQKDMVEFFGSQSIVSEVLNGKRAISKESAKKLAARFCISAEAFI